MVQSRGGLCLPLETSQYLWIFGYLIGKKLQRYKAVKTSILGFVDNTHSAASEFFEDAVVGNALPNKRVGVRHSAVILCCDRRQVNESDTESSQSLGNAL